MSTKRYTPQRVVHELFSDVDGTLSSKRLITFIAFLCTVGSWIANIFFKVETLTYIFEGMLWLTGAGLGFIASEKFARSSNNQTEVPDDPFAE